MGLLSNIWPPKLSHIWLFVCNIGILAITICILASYRSPSESNHSLLNIDRSLLGKIVGDECADATRGVTADVYRIGFAATILQSSCREIRDTVTCESHHPKLGWTALFEADIAAANVTQSQAAVLEECTDTLNQANVDHAFTGRLSTALFALLIFSTILNVSALVVSLICGSGFALFVFIIGLVDEIISVTCIGVFIGVINHEVGRYIPASVNLGDIDDKATLGVGFWMLLALFAARVISHPMLLVLTIAVCFSVVLIFLFLIFSCCLGDSSRDSVTVHLKRRAEDIYETMNTDKESRW